MIRIDIITVLPKIFDSVFNYGVIGRAIKSGKVKLSIHDLHSYALDKHKTVDDKPYGGGSGMVLKPEPIYRAIKKINKTNNGKKAHVIYLSPQGKVLNQKKIFELYNKKWLIILCGRYEGIDERVMAYVDEEISIGDYVLTGGEVPAMVLVDGVCRYAKGVVKEKESLLKESFLEKFLDFPQYTRPYRFLNKTVPKILLSGNHKEIEFYRLKERIRNTYKKRPELLKTIKLTKTERQILEKIIS